MCSSDLDALPAHEQAFRRLLKPNAIVIPAKGVVRVALAEDRKIGHRRMTQVEGFDVTPFNMLAPPRYRIPVGDERLVLKSAAADALLFDFQSGGPFPESRAEAAVTANAEGANGIVQWIRLDMDGQGHYEDAPAPGTSSAWATQFHPFPDGFRVAQSETIRVICEHDRHRLRIWPSREKP